MYKYINVYIFKKNQTITTGLAENRKSNSANMENKSFDMIYQEKCEVIECFWNTA